MPNGLVLRSGFSWFLDFVLVHFPQLIQGGGLEKTGGREDVWCNVYFSTMRAATDKRSSSVERVDQVDNG